MSLHGLGFGWHHCTTELFNECSLQLPIPFTKEASSELKWWSSGELKQLNGMALNPPAIDAMISTDTSKKGRRKNGGSVAEARRRTHQCIETEGSLPCCSCIWQGHHESTPCSGTYGQLYGGITSEGKGAFTNSGVRDMELLHLSENMDYSEICIPE